LALVVALATLALAIHIGTSLMGRGGRPVAGERHVVASSAGHDIVYYERTPRVTQERPAAHPVPIVLLASFARSVADFNELTESLSAAGYRTLTIEARGIGGSGGGGPGQDLTLHDLAADLGDVVDRAAPGSKIHAVGHAFGNRVVRTFARDRPERVETVTLLAAGGLVPISPAIQKALVASVSSFLPKRQREPALRLAFFSADSEIPEEWVGGWWLWGGWAQRAATAATSSDEFWDAGNVPLLVLQAEDDRLAPPEDSGLRLKAFYPDRVELVMVPNAGHALLPEQPEKILDAMLAYYSGR
jgi:pimeloyl-ACP methyl ester carboxylesterase